MHRMRRSALQYCEYCDFCRIADILAFVYVTLSRCVRFPVSTTSECPCASHPDAKSAGPCRQRGKRDVSMPAAWLGSSANG